MSSRVSCVNLLELARSELPIASKAAETVANPAAAHYRWGVILPDGSQFEVCCLPETTAEEMEVLYHGATVLPLRDAPDPAGRSAVVETPHEATTDVP
jgi:hypothetical protein